MRILVTNDDGVESPGLMQLAEEMRALGDVTVVAPDGDRSSISHRISFQAPVRISTVPGRSVPTFACSGTPADCVVLGAYELCGATPDLVVSGINRGANLGDDLNYSGTVAAAIEATVIGIRAIAVSLAGRWPGFADVYHWESASALALRVARSRWGIKPTSFLNLNVPNMAQSEVRGIRLTRQGRKRYEDRLVREVDEEGGAFYRISGRFDMALAGTQTDLEAVRDGYASITPITIDRTDAELLEALRSEPVAAVLAEG
ncbi:MAG: 5'/3'-nucleotidase SurE [Candidatus Eremiobacteraeota bacterium]|nr:5'/3'-nucleotidase SurE [Candidatus Eremiobacteraeota bacterium]